jgi:hypothetical protein
MREIVKKFALKFVHTMLLLASALAWAGEDTNSAEYTVNVHVGSSSIMAGGWQYLGVTIDGRNCNLQSEVTVHMLLALGDYKAKIVRDLHKTSYDSCQTYEFLFSDKKTRKFDVVGQTE